MLIFLIGASFCICVSAIITGRHEVVYPSIETLRSGEKRMNFRAFDKDFKLKLEPSGDIFGEGFYIQSTGDERAEIPSVNINEIKPKLFKDKRHGAALHIDETEDSTAIKGIINSELRIKPHDEGKRNADGILPHRVFEVIEHDTSRRNDAIFIPQGINLTFNDPPEELRQDEIIYVEICIVIDSTFRDQFKNNIKLIVEYLSVLIIGAQCRYDNLKDITVVLVFSSLRIPNSPSEEPYITNNLVQGCALSEPTLNDLGKFMGKLRLKCDMILLVTKYELADLENGKINTGVAGVMYIATVCDNSNEPYFTYKVGIAEDNADCHTGVRTFAHEVAHSLGCPHDGDGPVSYIPNHPGSASCSWDLGYIMSYIVDNERRFWFSPCCEKNIKHLAKLLSCLRQNNTRTDIQSSRYKPGEALEKTLGLSASNFIKHKQSYYNYRCKSMHGNDIKIMDYPEKKCDFACRTVSVNSQNYFTYWTHDCNDGEMCGTGMRCLNGKCT